MVLARISPASADDAVCDLQNSSRTQSGYAYDRAINAARNNRPLAVEQCWTQVSAAQGNPRAEDAMAMFCRDGEGVPQNPSTAFSWAQKSAAQGDPVGQALLGDFYKRGIGTLPNAQLAQYWQSKAQSQLAALQAQQRQEVAQANAQAQQKVHDMMNDAFWTAVKEGWFGSGNDHSQVDESVAEDEKRMKDHASACELNPTGLFCH
jgi:TPR repeat protein